MTQTQQDDNDVHYTLVEQKLSAMEKHLWTIKAWCHVWGFGGLVVGFLLVVLGSR